MSITQNQIVHGHHGPIYLTERSLWPRQGWSRPICAASTPYPRPRSSYPMIWVVRTSERPSNWRLGVQDGSLDLTGVDGTVDLMIQPLRSPLHGRSQVRRSKRRSPSSRRSPGQLSGRFRGEEARCSVLRMTETAKSGARHGVTWDAAAGPLATDHHWPGLSPLPPGTP